MSRPTLLFLHFLHTFTLSCVLWLVCERHYSKKEQLTLKYFNLLNFLQIENLRDTIWLNREQSADVDHGKLTEKKSEWSAFPGIIQNTVQNLSNRLSEAEGSISDQEDKFWETFQTKRKKLEKLIIVFRIYGTLSEDQISVP